MKESNEWYVEKGYSDLAGPYSQEEEWMLEGAVDLLKKGKIPYEVVVRDTGKWLRRPNMVIRKRYYKLKNEI